MSGFVVFISLILVEVGLLVLSLKEKSNLKKEKSVVRVVLFIVFILLIISPIIDWGFQWFMLGLFMGIQALLGLYVIIKRKDNSTSKNSRIILGFVNRIILVSALVLPTIIFPQYDQIMPTGEFAVASKSYTLTDYSREEYFTEDTDNRKITIELWYPTNRLESDEIPADGKYPLVVFSHGAFGYRMSNFSTFQELVSQGYIVCSIDHTYHSIFSKEEDGKTIIANMDFVNNVTKAQNGQLDTDKVYELQQEWMKLRTEDMKFVLNYIKEKVALSDNDSVFKSIDIDNIGVAGHSLGGATAAQIGRESQDVDAVIVIDGTMFGEVIGIESNKEIIQDIPYPKPIMNIYNQSHYEEALALKENYANIVAYNNATESYQVVVEGAGHLNFTDLPMVSPFLSKILGTGDVNAQYCIETTNQVVLQFFDHYLKSDNLEIAKERVY